MAYASNSDGYARNSGKRWRRDDVAALRDMVRRGAPLRLISLRLGRPDAAIRSKASDLGLSVSHPMRGPDQDPEMSTRQLELFGTA